jgi:uncharacterized protein (DUF2141 family)
MIRVAMTIFMAFVLVGAQPPQKCRLTITARSFRNARGSTAIAVYGLAEGFPDEPAKAVRRVLAPIMNDTATAVFVDLEPGTYAVVVLHDENGNGKMDKTVLGRPREGYGVSNNARLRTFGPPSFHDAAFVLDSSGRELVIAIHY